jgi:DNA-binding NarL/FixJ family response regulator
MLDSMPLSVLVVDDDAGFRGLARRVLGAAGLTVVGEAASAAEATAEALALRPDAVLLDVGLPDQSGLVIARPLAQLPWRPTVLLTSTDPVGPEAVERSGAAGFVPKHELPDAPLERLLARR